MKSNNSIYLKVILPILSIITGLFSTPFTSYAVVDHNAEAEARKELEIQSNLIEDWPLGPEIGAQGAILYEAETGAILYAKNIHEHLYPASITKVLTSYIALQNSNLDDTVNISQGALDSIVWWEDANIGIKAGEAISMKDALYAVMVNSANEVAYAVAEHISGDIPSFAKVMNNTAKELGCINSNFITPNGLHDENHYTTAYDMALIASAYFKEDLSQSLSSSVDYQIPKSATQSNDSMILSSKNKLFKNRKYEYESLIGSKTGYTDSARQTLVSCAKGNGMTLICVILKEETPMQYEDTINLFNYGFNNFNVVSVSDNDKTYTADSTDFFDTISTDIGASKSIIKFEENAHIILPKTATFEDTTSEISFEDDKSDSLATVSYFYNDTLVGTSSLHTTYSNTTNDAYFTRDNSVSIEKKEPLYAVDPDKPVIVINVKHLIFFIIISIVLITIIIAIIYIIHSYSFSNKYLPKRNRRRKRRKF